MNFVEHLMLFIIRLAMVVMRLVLRWSFDDVPHQFDDSVPLLPAYDFIVVGGGAAGSVVAGRLAEVGASVLLLEAGGSAPPETRVPGLVAATCLNEHYGWGLKTAPMKNTRYHFENDQQVLPQGRVMGGSVTINGLQYVRGFKLDFDNWVKLGNKGWDYPTVLSYFKRLENYTGPSAPTTDEIMGHNGPFSIGPATFCSNVTEAFLMAGSELGFKPTVPSGPASIGFFKTLKAITNGRRVTTAEAFVRPNIHRPGFHVRVNSHVTKILFDDQKRAIGVKFSTNRGQEQTARANKEVIVSGRVFQSPKLLMLSGVGPVEHLKMMGIPVVAGVEGVGRNLVDHHIVRNLVFSAKAGTTLDPSRIFTLSNFWDYLQNTKGPFTIAPGNEGQAYVNVDDPQDELPNVLIEMVGITLAKSGGYLVNYATGLLQQAFEELYPPMREAESVTISVSLTRPFSRGAVTLRSTDPFDNPLIDPNMLSNPRDEETMLKGIQFALKIANTTAMKEMLELRFIQSTLSACAHFEPFSEQYWRCFIRQTIEFYYHCAGTCRMAPDTDPLGVVSPRLEMRGVTGLRVVDASIMPQVVSTNIMATTIMIGERGADFIKEDWGYPIFQGPASLLDERPRAPSDETGRRVEL